MELILEQLNKSVVISQTDILDIKSNIEKRHGNESYARKATILAEALHRIVDKALVGIEEHLWPSLKRSLFKNTLAVNRECISKKDIFFEVISMEEDIGFLSVTTYKWMVEQKISGVDPGELGQFVKQHVENKLRMKHEGLRHAKVLRRSQRFAGRAVIKPTQSTVAFEVKPHIETVRNMPEKHRHDSLVNPKYRLTIWGWGVLLGIAAILLTLILQM